MTVHTVIVEQRLPTLRRLRAWNRRRRVRFRLVKTTLIPESGFGTADAGMAGIDRRTGSTVPFDGCAGVMGDRSAASELVKTPSLAGPLIVEGLSEQTLVEKTHPRAAVVHGVAVDRQRPIQGVQRRQATEGHEMRQGRGDRFRQRRAPWQVDQRTPGKTAIVHQVLDANCACRVGIGGWQTAECGAGADRDHHLCSFHRFDQDIEVGTTGDRGTGALAAQRHGTVDDKEITAGTRCLVTRRLSGGAAGGLQRVMVVEGNEIEDQGLEGRGIGAGQRLGTTGAFLEGQPHHRTTPCSTESMRDLGSRRRGQAQHRRQPKAALQEGPPAYTGGNQVIRQSPVRTHAPRDLIVQILRACSARYLTSISCRWPNRRPGRGQSRTAASPPCSIQPWIIFLVLNPLAQLPWRSITITPPSPFTLRTR